MDKARLVFSSPLLRRTLFCVLLTALGLLSLATGIAISQGQCAQYSECPKESFAIASRIVWGAIDWFGEHGEAIWLAATAFATVALWGATRDLVRGAEMTAERQLRAYLLPDSASLLSHPDNRLWLRVVLKNTGQTPARNLHSKLNCGFLKPGEQRQFPSERGPLLGTVGPGQVISVKFLQPNPLKSDQMIDAIFKSPLIFYIWGVATYDDIFGVAQTTNFRLTYSQDSDGFVICDEGNSAT